jgi:hypothetical protein
MQPFNRHGFAALVSTLALVACGSSSSSGTLPAQAAPARVRFVDGAPSLETLIGGVPQSICGSASAPCYLKVDGATVSHLFSYGSLSPFVNVNAGVRSLVAADEEGYTVGPLSTTSLQSGKVYTLIVVGSYPHYRVLTFEEPSGSGAQLSLYEASPTVPHAAFGTFRASSHSQFTQRGSAQLGNVVTVSLGKSVTDLGAYAGSASSPIGTVTPVQLNSFDRRNALPFKAASRLSLFLLDPKSGSTLGPVFGSLDR